MTTNQVTGNLSVEHAIEISIRLGLIVLLVVLCLNILSPFISLVLWAAVIAVAMSRPFGALQRKLGGSRKLAVTVFIVLGLGIILTPSIMLFESLIQSTTSIGQGIADGTVEIEPPSDSVRDWPLIGERVHRAWTNASTDLSDFVNDNSESLAEYGRTLANAAVGVAGGILQFSVATIIAGIFLANAEACNSGLRQISRRLSGDRGDELIDLSVSTIRSVAVGVLGIAFIQAVLGGLGMVVVGVPGAGLWALAILVLAIAQLPPLLILGPAAIWVFSVETTTVSVIFLFYAMIVSISDTMLKPLLLGRGVEAPMLVILLGAIGGMIYAGIVGLFLGAVVLALGYKLMLAWLDQADAKDSGDPAIASSGST